MNFWALVRRVRSSSSTVISTITLSNDAEANPYKENHKKEYVQDILGVKDFWVRECTQNKMDAIEYLSVQIQYTFLLWHTT